MLEGERPPVDGELFRYGSRDGGEPRLFWWLFWPCTFLLFALVHFPIDRLDALIRHVFSALPDGTFPATWSGTSGEITDPKKVGALLISPMLGFLFYGALLVLLLPFVRSILRSGFCPSFARFLRSHKRLVCGSFAGLCILTVPFRQPYALSGLGFFAAKMSLSPFDRTSEEFPWTYRRLLMPALANSFQLRGALYWGFSLLCTIGLLALVMYCIDQWSGSVSGTRRDRVPHGSSSLSRTLVLVSMCTSSFIMSNFIWPGYPEQLAYALILVAASAPMTRLARLAIVALALLAHEATAFALTPIIVICFPRGERLRALSIIGIYGLLWLLSASLTGTTLTEILTTHQILGSQAQRSVLSMIHDHPGRFALGVALGHKLAWLAVGFAFFSLWRQGRRADARALLVLTLVPLLALLVAWDTSRMTGLGFLGVVFSIALLLQSGLLQRRVVLFVALLNLLTPSYNIMLVEPISYPFDGAYNGIHAALMWLHTVLLHRPG